MPVAAAGTSLTDLSDIWFGDGSFRFAIMLATNARAGTSGMAFIGDPNRLTPGAVLCIPQIDEAERLRRRYDRYVEAVRAMALAEPWEVVNSLNPLPQTGTYRVATWIRADQVSRFPSKPSSGFDYPVSGDTWVTLEAYIKSFCNNFARTVSNDPAAVNLRLEQRLGLPPISGKGFFAVLELDATAANGGARVFRPCGSAVTGTTSCSSGIPNPCDAKCQASLPFFYQQYYSAYGTALPTQYPWTSLGYTFDWAPQPATFGARQGYVRVGESEYVVPKGTMTKFIGTFSTMQFCSAA